MKVIIFLLLLPLHISAQKNNIKATKLTVDNVYKSDSIVFYGYDFSHLKFLEEKRKKQG